MNGTLRVSHTNTYTIVRIEVDGRVVTARLPLGTIEAAAGAAFEAIANVTEGRT